MLFDREVRAAIAHWGPAYGVRIDSGLVHGIIEQESAHGKYTTTYEPNVKDTSRGPMMVRDATARSLGAANPMALEDPATGIWYGVKYLATLLKRFNGDTARAVTAYNGSGPAARAYAVKVLALARRYAAVGIPVALALALLAYLFLIPRRRAAVSR
jgi:soluble lytic murein transglycosylase-like protein